LSLGLLLACFSLPLFNKHKLEFHDRLFCTLHGPSPYFFLYLLLLQILLKCTGCPSQLHYFAWKLVKQEKDSGVQGGTLLLEIFLGSSNISKVERVSVPILTDEVSLETISFFLVANSLLVLMSSLKANSLLITGKMFANIPSLHDDAIDMAQKISNLWFGCVFLEGVGNIGSWHAKNALKCLCLFSAFFPKIAWQMSKAKEAFDFLGRKWSKLWVNAALNCI
jgi:hypothetical protein